MQSCELHCCHVKSPQESRDSDFRYLICCLFSNAILYRLYSNICEMRGFMLLCVSSQSDRNVSPSLTQSVLSNNS